MNLDAGTVECGGIKYKVIDIRPCAKISIFFDSDSEISIAIESEQLETIPVTIPKNYGFLLQTSIRDNIKDFLMACLEMPIELSNYFEEYYFNGEHHRIGGPALSCGSFFKYYKHGKLHRIDGPTHLTKDGWCYNINGKELPASLPRYFEDKLIGTLTRSKVLEAMQFDREYGLFLKGKLRNNEKDKCD